MVLNTKQKRPTSIQHRKRHGQHHKVTKPYAKTYWPYLPLVLVLAIGVIINSTWGRSQRNVLGYATDMSVGELLTGTNAQRSASGEAALSLNGQLDNAAQAKANDMVAQDYWAHTSPSGETPWQFITQAGYNYAAAGENLAYGFDTSQDVVAAWMGSPEHRANILNSSYQDVGFGIANATNYQSSGPETIVVAEYGEPVSAAPAAPVASTPPVSSSAPAQRTPTSVPAAPTPQATATPSQPSSAKTSPSLPTTNESNQQPPRAIALQARPVSRLQLLTNVSSLTLFTVSALATLSIAVFLLRHGLAWRRVFRKGEVFAIRHHLLDVLLLSIGVIGFILTRNAGMIH